MNDKSNLGFWLKYFIKIIHFFAFVKKIGSAWEFGSKKFKRSVAFP